MNELTRRGWKVTVAVHLPTDWALTAWLQGEGVEFEVADLYRQPTDAVVEFYRGQALTVGMRGHSQMIPFGLQNGIISLISHDKLGWFLDDIGHPEWGAEVREPDLDERLIELTDKLTNSSTETLAALEETEARLWDTTRTNVELVREELGVEV